MIGENIFPAQIPAEIMKEPTEQYYKEVFQIGCKVMEILAKGLPYGDDVFANFLSGDPICSLRLLHYPPQVTSDEKQLGAGAHTDFGASPLPPTRRPLLRLFTLCPPPYPWADVTN